MKPNAAKVATAAEKNSSVPQTLPVGPSVFLWTPSTQQLPLPNPCCHGSQQVQTSSVVVIVESHTVSVNTHLLSQDWSCKFWGDWRQIERSCWKTRGLLLYYILVEMSLRVWADDGDLCKNPLCMEALINEVRMYQNNQTNCKFKPAQRVTITKENTKSRTNLIASIGKSVWSLNAHQPQHYCPWTSLTNQTREPKRSKNWRTDPSAQQVVSSPSLPLHTTKTPPQEILPLPWHFTSALIFSISEWDMEA